MPLFEDPLHDEFAMWTLGFALYGGGDYGEVQLLASQVKAGGDGSFLDAFQKLAERRIEEGDNAVAEGHPGTARDCYLRAAGLLGVGYHPLYDKPPDPRLVDAFHLQMATFEKGLALGPSPAEAVHVPYEDTALPAWFLRAPGHDQAVRPTILVGGGWDSTMVENYFGIGAAALARGYHVLLHDGPGQGRLLVDEGRPLRHDWEHVVTPVVDAALWISGVVPDAGDRRRVRPRLVQRPGALRRPHLPQELPAVPEPRRRRRPLRDAQPIDGQPSDHRLARPHPGPAGVTSSPARPTTHEGAP